MTESKSSFLESKKERFDGKMRNHEPIDFSQIMSRCKVEKRKNPEDEVSQSSGVFENFKKKRDVRQSLSEMRLFDIEFDDSEDINENSRVERFDQDSQKNKDDEYFRDSRVHPRLSTILEDEEDEDILIDGGRDYQVAKEVNGFQCSCEEAIPKLEVCFKNHQIWL
jgi:hypothetical protein